MKNTHIRNLKQVVPFKERMETYKEALDIYERNLERLKKGKDTDYPSCVTSGSINLLLPCLLWDLNSFHDSCPDSTSWCFEDVKETFPEIQRKDRGYNKEGLVDIIKELKSILNINSNIMYTIEKLGTPKPKIMRACDTKISDIMEIDDPEMFQRNGEILVHSYDGFVSLNNPRSTWGEAVTMKVRVLEPGESVTLTVK